MAYPAYVKEKARKLRREKHLTIDELSDRLAISRTTIFYWVGDLPIPITEKQSAAQRRASHAITRKALQLREAAYEEGLKWFAFFERDPKFRDFICMYIGEGYKRNRNTVTICNSDPAVLKLAKPWFELFSANPITFQCSVPRRPASRGNPVLLELGVVRCVRVDQAPEKVQQRKPVGASLAITLRRARDDRQGHILSRRASGLDGLHPRRLALDSASIGA